MTLPQNAGAGNMTVAVCLCLASLAGVLAVNDGILLIPTWVAALPAGYVVLRSFLHTVIVNAVRQGNVLAANEIALMDDMYEGPDEDGLGRGEAVVSDHGPTILDADAFAAAAKTGVSGS